MARTISFIVFNLALIAVVCGTALDVAEWTSSGWYVQNLPSQDPSRLVLWDFVQSSADSTIKN